MVVLAHLRHSPHDSGCLGRVFLVADAVAWGVRRTAREDCCSPSTVAEPESSASDSLLLFGGRFFVGLLLVVVGVGCPSMSSRRGLSRGSSRTSRDL